MFTAPPPNKTARWFSEKSREFIEFTPIAHGMRFPSAPLKSGNTFTVPCTLLNILILHKYGYTMMPQLLLRKEQLKQAQLYEGDLPQHLMPFQEEGVRKMLGKNGVLLADEQGLGKTLQLITYIDKKPELRPCVIVCPAHLKYNWFNEFAKWTPHLNVAVLQSRTPYSVLADIMIINYEILPWWKEYFSDVKLVVCDEAHRIRNRATKSSRAVLALGKKGTRKPIRIMATGTPLIKDPVNVWMLVNSIDPKILGGLTDFRNYFTTTQTTPIYVGGEQLSKGSWKVTKKEMTGTCNLDLLNTVLTASVMIRRTKKEVLPQMPNKVLTVLPVDAGVAKDYQSTIAAMAASNSAFAAYTAYTNTLYSALGKGKIPHAIQWIEDFLQGGDEQLVVAGWHRGVTLSIYEQFKKDAALVIGGITDKEAQLDAFVSGRKRLLVGNIHAAGTGLTLTNASNMVFVELPLLAVDLFQMMDRIHRIGQEKQCNYYFVIAKNTLEEKIMEKIDIRAKMANDAIDAGGGEEIDLQKLAQEALT